MNNIFLSVIIPTANRNDLLKLCLQRLLPNTQQLSIDKYEVIVTDDGVNDQAKTLIEKEFSSFTWVSGPKRGPASNRNNGAKHAKGDWLVFLDDDCVPSENILHEYSNCINDHKNINVFEGAIYPDGNRTSPLDYAPINDHGGHLWSCNFCIKKQVFNELGGFDEYFKFPHMEDNDLNLRIQATNNKIIFCRNAIVKHPWRKITSGVKLGRYQEMYIYFHEKHNKKYSLVGLLWSITKVHLVLLKQAIFHKDCLVAVKILFEHLLTVIKNYKNWKKRYARS